MSKIFQLFAVPRANRDKGDYLRLPRDVNGKSSLEDESQDSPRNKTLVFGQVVSFAGRLLIVSFAAYGLYSLLTSPSPSTLQPRGMSCNCGETIEEARANDCVYDSLAAAWLPPHCRSPELTAEFESLGPNEPDAIGNTWGYWHDKNKTNPMTLEEVSQLPEAARHGQYARFFATHEWHLVHCVFYWRKMWEAARCARGDVGAFCGKDGVLVIEKRYDTLMHINHCLTMFLMRDPLNHIAAEAGVALHSDELHIAKPHKHHDPDSEDKNKSANIKSTSSSNSNDPYDETKESHKHGKGDPYDD
ncbi:hypothetical protein CORC01_02871 [Colletotrichum orchidophilum]|uniref:Uncharacterized protein n=1 Tax=Colletotrichum orchidophilum TaxID=1209926 RepID=A0A1G4BJL5_9PEZI|nr:uncharacterized protein CORC01_02871 [Colletotrichum orchidophilum]OHF01680.1 hypothetical protein CORC01_02871 [Colletotrichum orchidophilum]